MRGSILLPVLVSVASLTLSACSSASAPQDSSGEPGLGTGKTAGSSGSTAGSSVRPFPFPPVTYQGGSLIAAPAIVTVTFPGDSSAPSLATFATSVASSSYWDAVRAGYCGGGDCVGDGTAEAAVALTAPPDSSYTDSSTGGASTLQTFLRGLVTAGAVPAPDANTLYALYLPAETSIAFDGMASCQDFEGYHNSMTMGSQEVNYAVISECPAPRMTPAITALENATVSASHEIVEAATDPEMNRYSFALDLADPSTWGWADIQGVEIADLCLDPFRLGQDEATENGYTVQRVWSVQNASAGKNPCVPIPSGEAYFNVYPTDSVLVMDVGQSKTIEIDAGADGDIGSWMLTAQDWTDATGQSLYLTFSIQNGTGAAAGPEVLVQSGDRLELQVTMTADPSGTPYGEADAVLVSTNQSQTAAHFWPFVVLTTAAARDAGVTTMRHAEGRLAPHVPTRSRAVRRNP